MALSFAGLLKIAKKMQIVNKCFSKNIQHIVHISSAAGSELGGLILELGQNYP
jgi:hypothetical protein